MQLRTIYIFGIGGIGGFIGTRIIHGIKKAGTIKVYFIARGAHRDEISKNGLILESENETVVSMPAAAVSDLEGIPEPDLCFLCVKSYDLEDACRKLKNKITKESVIIPILNGVDIYQRVRAVIDTGYVLPGCVYMNAFVKQPGVIKHMSGNLFVYGRDPLYKDHYPKEVVEFLNGIPDVTFRWEDDPYQAIWEKYMFVAAYALVTAHSRRTLRNVYDDAGLRKYVVEIIKEIMEIAVRKGYSFPPDIVESLTARAGKLPYEATTSYQRDIQTGKNEGELFGETIVRMGKELDVATPVTGQIYNEVQKMYKSP